MHKRSYAVIVGFVAWLLPVQILGQWTEKIDWVTDHVVVFPQVASGTVAGAYIQTKIVLINPSSSQLTVEIGASRLLGQFVQSLTLESLETRELTIDADDYVAGWMLLDSPSTFGADVHIVIKPSRDSDQVLTRIALPGQIPVSKVVFPVQLNSGLADTTAFAVGVCRPLTSDFRLKFTIYNPDGTAAMSTERPLRPYTAMYVPELFPDILPRFPDLW